jgi:hypothetical protein
MKRTVHLGKVLGLAGLALLLTPALLWANDLITCHYLQASGQEIRLELDIGRPAPASVIVIQHLPRGTGIKSSSPRLQKFNKKRSEAKWLLKGPRPGLLTMAMHLDRPVKKGAVSGELRYMNPATGKMVTMRIAP